MDIISTHFWLICGLWAGIGGGGYFRYQLKSNLDNHDLTVEEIDKFTRQYALWIFIPCLLLWLVQLSPGFESEAFFNLWPHPQKFIASTIQIIIWFVLLYWVFLKNGADLYSKYLLSIKSNLNIFASPSKIKPGSVLVVVSGIYALFIA